MLFIVEYVETMYVYTLEYVYIYRIYVYMYLYVNKESLLNLSLTRSIFGWFFSSSFVWWLYGDKNKWQNTPTTYCWIFVPSAICSSVRYLSLQYSGQNKFSSIHEGQGKKCMRCSTQSWTASANAPEQATESRRAVLNERCYGASGSALQQPKHLPVEETACMELWPSAAASHHFLGAVHGIPTTSSPSFGTIWQLWQLCQKTHCEPLHFFQSMH